MANDSIIPNEPTDGSALPLDIEVLFAGNLADDDLMWIVRCSTARLHGFVQAPVAWVASLAALPGWRYFGSDSPAPAATLLPDFAMRVESAAPDPDGWVTLQGISETNAVTLVGSLDAALRSALGLDRVGPEAARRLGTSVPSLLALTPERLGAEAGAVLDAFWDDVAADPKDPALKRPFPVNVVTSLDRFYGHFEICDARETWPQRAVRIASFLLASSSDPKGYAAMLAGLAQRTLYVGSGSAREGAAIAIAPPTGPVSVSYASLSADAPEDPNTTGDDEPTTACGIVDGPFVLLPTGDGGTGTASSGMVKAYGGSGNVPPPQ